MRYYHMYYDQGNKIPWLLKGGMFFEFVGSANDSHFDQWRLDYAVQYAKIRDGLWFVTPEKKINLDFYTKNSGVIISEKFFDNIKDLIVEPYKICSINFVNSRQDENSTNKMFFLMFEHESGDIVDFSKIVEDNLYYQELLGEVKIGRDATGNRYILRSMSVPFRDWLGNFFRGKGDVFQDLWFCSEEFMRRCKEAKLRGPGFSAIDDCIVVDFQPDMCGGIDRVGAGLPIRPRLITKTGRKKWDGLIQTDQPMNRWATRHREGRKLP